MDKNLDVILLVVVLAIGCGVQNLVMGVIN